MTMPSRSHGAGGAGEPGRALAQAMGGHEGRLVRLGGWLFVRRGWLPLLALPVLLFPSPYELRPGWQRLAIAGVPPALGEALRLWAVGYAGPRTRTRLPCGRLKDLVTTGPFAYVRNPIYLGNCLLAAGLILLF